MTRKMYEQSMYENAMDSIDRSIDLLTYDYELEKVSTSKQAITMLYHGIELLLKDRLMEIQISLAWENVDSYPSLEARTVGLDKAIHRLINIGGLNINEDTIKTFRELKKIRNSIEHFSWSINQNKAEKLFAKSLIKADMFSAEYIGFTFFGYKDYREGRIDELFKKNGYIESVYKNNQRLWDELAKSKTFLCGRCHATIDEEHAICNKCGEDNRPWTDMPDEEIPF